MARNWVLLRGLVRESRHWQGFEQQFQAFFPDDQVVALDLPGNGYLHDQDSATQVAPMVASAQSQLSERGLQPPFHVIALSLGAMTAISWLEQHPQQLGSVVLMNTSVARFSPFWKRLRYQNYGTVLRGLLSEPGIEREQLILELTTNHLSASQRQQVAEDWAEYARQAPVSRRNGLRQLRAAARFKAPAQLPSDVPVLVLNGAGDRLVSPDCSSALANAWQLPMDVHPTAGHDLTLDQGGWVIERIDRWHQAGFPKSD